MILQLTTEEEFQYFKWRDGYIIIQDPTRTFIHRSYCLDVELSSFRQNLSNHGSYFTTEDLDYAIQKFQAEKCINCCSN
jgi:hypothetical protein